MGSWHVALLLLRKRSFAPKRIVVNKTFPFLRENQKIENIFQDIPRRCRWFTCHVTRGADRILRGRLDGGRAQDQYLSSTCTMQIKAGSPYKCMLLQHACIPLSLPCAQLHTSCCPQLPLPRSHHQSISSSPFHSFLRSQPRQASLTWKLVSELPLSLSAQIGRTSLGGRYVWFFDHMLQRLTHDVFLLKGSFFTLLWRPWMSC